MSSHKNKLLTWAAYLVALLLLSIAISCVYNLKYLPDLNFLPSAAANSPEYLISLNDKTCKDVDGIVGLCAKRIKRNEDLRINILAQDYSYTYNLQCSNNINFNKQADVPIHQAVEIIIPHDIYAAVNIFNCSIDITPHDRPEPIASFAAFRIVVMDATYMALPEISRYNKYLVLGQHAYKSIVFENDNIKMLNKKTYYETKAEKAVVESYNQRFAYRGF
jgi:hypothetical protein